jgi:hypothetical protein
LAYIYTLNEYQTIPTADLLNDQLDEDILQQTDYPMRLATVVEKYPRAFKLIAKAFAKM